MSDPDAPPLDERRIAQALDAHGVEYVLVGGLGARLRGAAKVTRDFDFCPATTPENLDRVAAALRSLGARLRVEKIPEGLEVPIDAVFLNRMEISAWRTEAGDIDVLKGIPAATMAELNHYTELLPEAKTVDFAGCRVYVASLDHIILSKETANRPARPGSVAGAACSPCRRARRRPRSGPCGRAGGEDISGGHRRRRLARSAAPIPGRVTAKGEGRVRLPPGPARPEPVGPIGPGPGWGARVLARRSSWR